MNDPAARVNASTPFPGYFGYEAARRPFSYDIFLSSSDEVKDLRNVVHDLVTHSFGPALKAYSEAQLEVVRWEQALSEMRAGETINDRFVRAAVECHHTLVLLMTHLGSGTREEIEAVVAKERPISILRFDPPPGHQSEFDGSEIDAFIKELEANGTPISCEMCGQPGSEGAFQSVSKTLAGLMMAFYVKYLEESKPSLEESRG